MTTPKDDATRRAEGIRLGIGGDGIYEWFFCHGCKAMVSTPVSFHAPGGDHVVVCPVCHGLKRLKRTPAPGELERARAAYALGAADAIRALLDEEAGRGA